MGCLVREPLVTTVARCPPLKSYTPAQSVAIGEARTALRLREPGSILLEVIDDAFALRQQCRAYAPADAKR